MKFILPVLALTLSGAANAANCYSPGGSTRCVSKDNIWQFREWFCTQEWKGSSDNKLYNNDNGSSARFRFEGPFTSQQQCWDSTENIINQCFGNRDGGSWNTGGVSVNINFCA